MPANTKPVQSKQQQDVPAGLAQTVRHEDNSTNKLPFHPAADLFALLEGTEFDELVGDIKRRGLHVPITTIDDGKGRKIIIDGRNRYRACMKAGVEPTYTTFQGEADDVVQFIISANIHRRHLKPDYRRRCLKQLLKLNPEQSDRQISAAAKVDHKTVGKLRSEMQATGEIPQLTKTIGKDGKARPAKKEPGEVTKLIAKRRRERRQAERGAVILGTAIIASGRKPDPMVPATATGDLEAAKAWNKTNGHLAPAAAPQSLAEWCGFFSTQLAVASAFLNEAEKAELLDHLRREAASRLAPIVTIDAKAADDDIAAASKPAS